MKATRRLKPWMLVSAAWILPAAFAMLNRVAQGMIHDWGPASLREVLFEGGDWLLYALLTPAVFAVSRRHPVTRESLRRTLAFHAAMAILFCVAWATCGKVLELGLTAAFDPDGLRKALAGEHLLSAAMRNWVSWIFVTLPFGTGVYLCMVGIEHATRYFVEANERAVQLSTLGAQLAEARLASLQAQLNPHFLFNALNTINVLVRDRDTQTAIRVIGQLSDLLRRTLGHSRGSETRLDDELALVRDHLAVEEARYPDRLRPVFDVEEGIGAAAVPAFSVQHLVENAIRHGIGRRTDSGRVTVRARRVDAMLEITVEDDGAGIGGEQAPSSGGGLVNTRERLRTLYGVAASLEIAGIAPHGTIATLILPYHEWSEHAG